MARGPTILYVISDLEIGGAERHLSQILPRLAREGFRPIVYTLTHKGRLAPELENGGVEVLQPPYAHAMHRLPEFLRPCVSFPMTALALWRNMLERHPDIVHFFLPAGYLIGGLCSLLARVPRRVMSRRSLNDYQRKHPVLSWLEFWLHHRMTAVIGNSRAVVAQLADEGVPTDKLGLIYNGVDLESLNVARSRAEMRASLSIDEDALVLTNVANLIAYKGHVDLLEGLATVATQLGRRWVLLCVGRDTGIGNSLRRLAKTRGLERNVRWLGERQEISDILNASDIGVLCSHQEGFSNTVLEGMAAGLPMIVSDVGGNREAVVDGQTGLVVPPKNPEAIGRAVLKLAGDPALRTQMGSAARKRVHEVFPISRCVVSYVRLYHGLLQSKPYPIEKTLRRPS